MYLKELISPLNIKEQVDIIILIWWLEATNARLIAREQKNVTETKMPIIKKVLALIFSKTKKGSFDSI